MRDFRQIQVWKKAHQLTLEIYQVTARFPKEFYGLTSQLRRAAASIAANIAEGFGRGGDIELARFLQIAIGSAYELNIISCWQRTSALSLTKLTTVSKPT